MYDTGIIREYFGTVLRNLRKFRGISGTELQKMTGIPYATIRGYETRPNLPRLEMFLTLCNALNVTADQIYKLCVKEMEADKNG